MTELLSSIPFEFVIVFVLICIPTIIWSFFKMKKDHPTDCSRIILLSFIPLLISIGLQSYCYKSGISGFLEHVSNILFAVCLSAVFLTIAIVTLVSYKQKGEYFETLKERKQILIMCGVVFVIGIMLVLCAKYFF